MKKLILNELEKVVIQDFNDMQSVVHQSLYDKALRPFFRDRDGCIGSGLLPSKVNATTVQIAAGTGFFYDAAQTGYNAKYRPIRLEAAVEATIEAADATNPRWDIVCIAPDQAVSATEQRYVKDAETREISLQTIDKVMSSTYDIQVVTGVPGVSPEVPATPAGYMKIAEVYVTAVNGIVNSADVHDVRDQLLPEITRQPVVKTQSYALQGEETVICDATAGDMEITLPPVATMLAKQIHIKKSDLTDNAVQLTPDGAETINGVAGSMYLSEPESNYTLIGTATGWQTFGVGNTKSAGQVVFPASGAITQGDPVALVFDGAQGKVEKLRSSNAFSLITHPSINDSAGQFISFHRNSGVGIIVYKLSDGTTLKAVGVKILGGVATWGTPITLSSGTAVSMVCNPVASRDGNDFLIAFTASACKLIGVTVNPSTLGITAGSVVSFTEGAKIAIAANKVSGRYAAVYSVLNGGDYDIKCSLVTMSNLVITKEAVPSILSSQAFSNVSITETTLSTMGISDNIEDYWIVAWNDSVTTKTVVSAVFGMEDALTSLGEDVQIDNAVIGSTDEVEVRWSEAIDCFFVAVKGRIYSGKVSWNTNSYRIYVFTDYGEFIGARHFLIPGEHGDVLDCNTYLSTTSGSIDLVLCKYTGGKLNGVHARRPEPAEGYGYAKFGSWAYNQLNKFVAAVFYSANMDVTSGLLTLITLDVDKANRFSGIAMQTVNDGDDVIVVTPGFIADCFAGKTKGQKVYIQADGTIGTTPTQACIGYYISASELRVETPKHLEFFIQ